MKGKVKSYSEQRGFGFIEQQDSQEDIFFHISQVLSEAILQRGDQVSYEVGEGRKGREAAVKVKLIDQVIEG